MAGIVETWTHPSIKGRSWRRGSLNAWLLALGTLKILCGESDCIGLNVNESVYEER